MKWHPTIKPACENCRVVRRNGNVVVICKEPHRKAARA